MRSASSLVDLGHRHVQPNFPAARSARSTTPAPRPPGRLLPPVQDAPETGSRLLQGSGASLRIAVRRGSLRQKLILCLLSSGAGGVTSAAALRVESAPCFSEGEGNAACLPGSARASLARAIMAFAPESRRPIVPAMPTRPTSWAKRSISTRFAGLMAMSWIA